MPFSLWARHSGELVLADARARLQTVTPIGCRLPMTAHSRLLWLADALFRSQTRQRLSTIYCGLIVQRMHVFSAAVGGGNLLALVDLDLLVPSLPTLHTPSKMDHLSRLPRFPRFVRHSR